MPIYQDSRYAGVNYTAVLGKDQISRKYLHPRDPHTFTEVNTDWTLHEAAYGDDLDLLAYQYTGNNAQKSKYWWLIADVNGILWPLDIEPGTKLVVPTQILNGKGPKG